MSSSAGTGYPSGTDQTIPAMGRRNLDQSGGAGVKATGREVLAQTVKALARPLLEIFEDPEVEEVVARRGGRCAALVGGRSMATDVAGFDDCSLDALALALARLAGRDPGHDKSGCACSSASSFRIVFDRRWRASVHNDDASKALASAVVIGRRAVEAPPLASMEIEGALSTEHAELIAEAVSRGGGILVAGLPGSGKTTFLRSLLEELPEPRRALALDPSGELDLDGEVWALRCDDPSKAENALEHWSANCLVIGRDCREKDYDCFWSLFRSACGGPMILGSLNIAPQNDPFSLIQSLASSDWPNTPSSTVADLVRRAFELVVRLEREPGKPPRVVSVEPWGPPAEA